MENRQKQLITVPDNNKNYKGSGFKRWDALVADYFAEHPDSKKDNTPPANSRKRKRK